MKKTLFVASIVLTSSFSYAFDFDKLTKDVVENITKTQSSSSNNTKTSNLEDSTISKGLKEALKTGVSYAVKELGAKNGYLNNSSVKIPLPSPLDKAETLIRKAGGDKIADDLINSMNKAATNAAPKTANIFLNAIEKMSIEDAKKILSGNSDAATQYFKNNTSQALKELITPLVQNTMKENKVASYYNTANSFYKSNVKNLVENSSVMSYAKQFGADKYLKASDENLDEYVTNKAIDGLFKIIAQKEASIRKNPIEQTTSLLKKVFGN